MRVLVFGRSGQLSHALGRCALPAGWVMERVGRERVDIADAEQVNAEVMRFSPDVIINAAAYTNVDLAESNERQAYAVNCDGAANVARAASQRDCPVIHISTDFVFSGDAHEPYTEADAVGPLSVYGASKEAGERAVRDFAPAHIIVRTSWLYSASDGNFVTAIVRHLSKSSSISVVDDQTGSPTYASDLASTLIEMAAQLDRRNDEQYGTFHVADTGSISRYVFAREIQAAMTRRLGREWSGASCEIVPIASALRKDPAARPTFSSLSCAKLQTVYGLTLPEWRESLEVCLVELADRMS
ncbi:dTDP-4-dehydrorhamnose reductase [Magnetovibrio sp.]|uniref:dTDP-4-dehydrorhamnose reductase n=1 Tax=Magnetovibrio sp. TaxID=2024836 RepID=UPI002F94B753